MDRRIRRIRKESIIPTQYRVAVVPGASWIEAGVRTRHVTFRHFQGAAEYVRTHRHLDTGFVYQLESREQTPWKLVEVKEEE